MLRNMKEKAPDPIKYVELVVDDVTREIQGSRIAEIPARPQFTLRSAEARRHADFVLEKYGIDIYEENLRRWNEGTLEKDKILTFVKAVERENAEPNKLEFIHAS